MPSSKPAGDTSVRRDGATLVFAGPLLREHVATVWPQAVAQRDGVTGVDLREVPRVDSAGLAMLAELVAGIGHSVSIDGAPAGLTELCTAYRLDNTLGFAT